MSLLQLRAAKVIRADAEVPRDAVAGQADRLTSFLQRDLSWFCRSEPRAASSQGIGGRLGGLERKTSESIAIQWSATLKARGKADAA